MPLAVLGGLALLGGAGVLAVGGDGARDRGAGLPGGRQRGRAPGRALRLLVVVLVGGRGDLGRRGADGSGAGSRRRRWRWWSSGDLWSIDRLFFVFRGPASEVFGDDPVTSRLAAPSAKPFRVLDVGVYQGSYLMAHDIQTMLGYHGNEVRFYDELLGGKNEWRNAGSPTLLDLLGRALSCCSPRRSPCPASTRCWARSTTTPGSPAVLLERDTCAPTCASCRQPPSCPTIRPCRPSSTPVPLQRGRALSGHGRAHARSRIRGGQAARRPWPSGRRLADWAPGAHADHARRCRAEAGTIS